MRLFRYGCKRNVHDNIIIKGILEKLTKMSQQMIAYLNKLFIRQLDVTGRYMDKIHVIENVNSYNVADICINNKIIRT